MMCIHVGESQMTESELDKELLQDKIEVCMMALKVSLEEHYTPDKLVYVMKLIEDIWRLMLKQEKMEGDRTAE